MGFFDDMFGGMFGGGDKEESGGGSFQPTQQRETQNDIVQLPDYPEAEGARVNWWDTLQDWQGQEGYGAIAPNWDDIWKSASDKVQRFYQGGPEGQGEFGRAKANLARRGVSEQPGADNVLARMGFQQGNQLQEMATKEALEKANFGEAGRKTWLGSLQSLAGMKPQFATQGTLTTDYDFNESSGMGDILGGGIGQFLEGGGGGETLDKLLGGFGGGGAGGGQDTGIGDVTKNFLSQDELDFQNQGQGGGGDEYSIASLIGMFCWVAAEVFDGWGDNRTTYARYYIANVGPKWFKKWYGKNGKQIAAFISDKSILKAMIRPLFSAFAFFGKEALEGKGATMRDMFVRMAPKILPLGV